jgi:uncharacterized protein (DUF2062 family)
MRRKLFRKLAVRLHGLRGRWYVDIFGHHLTDSRLFSLQRRAITGAFGSGLAICFVPLPVHIPLAIVVSMLARLNVAVLVFTVFLINPLTVVPTYYAAYRVGAALLGLPASAFKFELSWNWLQYGLGPLWKPFLLGCLVCGSLLGSLGWVLLELLWRWRVTQRYRVRGRRAKR